MLLHITLVTYYIMEEKWEHLGDFGANQVHFGSKIGTLEIASKYNRTIRVFRI